VNNTDEHIVNFHVKPNALFETSFESVDGGYLVRMNFSSNREGKKEFVDSQLVLSGELFGGNHFEKNVTVRGFR